MTETKIEQTIDVREMPPRQRHPTIFQTWNELPSSGSIILINDHDPLPLYYQFAAEHEGGFRWEYEESGPEVWRVRISKGTFADPGFVPSKKALMHSCAAPIQFVKPLELDTRPLFAAGQKPCDAIDQAVARLIPGQPLVLLVPFEPVPLYAKLKAQGFSHQARPLDDGTWRVEFRKTVVAQTA
ncbi:MAG: DUF2249 domain-containing protein [Verrucomicrobiota bacterium]